MQEGVASRANRPKVFDRVDLVRCPDRGERTDMVHMDIPFRFVPISRCKRHIANRALRAIMIDALRACFAVPFVGVDYNPPAAPLGEQAVVDLLRIGMVWQPEALVDECTESLGSIRWYRDP